MAEIGELQSLVKLFIDSRDWRQFQNTKELALSTVVESSELLELFQWRSGDDMDEELRKGGELLYHVKSELADILFGCLAISDHLGLDLESLFRSKLSELDKRYPVEEVRGKVTKNSEGRIEF